MSLPQWCNVRSIFLRKRAYRSNDDVLKSLLGRKLHAELVSQRNDWRTLPEHAARLLNCRPQDFLGRLSKRHGLRYASVLHPFEPIDGSSSIDLSEWHNMGALPVRAGTTISAAICVDPSKVVALVNRYGLQEVCCGLWGDIQKALEESDLLGCVKKKRDAITIDLQLQTIARKALEVIFEEVEKHGDPSQTPRMVQLKKAGGTYEYDFHSKDGSRAVGSIDPRLWQALVAVVFQLRDRGDFKVHSGIDGTLHLTLDTRVPLYAKVTPAELALHSEKSLVAALPRPERLILLIEDNSTFAAVIARFLSRHGMKTIHCSDGEAACKLLQAGQVDPQLIVCDVHMPRMNGVEFVTRLRALERFKSVPTLVLTSDLDTELELEVLRVGADLLLPKTVDPRILCAHADRLMSHGERTLEVRVA